MMKNIRGAREFLIGYGKSHPNQLGASDKEFLHRWYGVSPEDYEPIASSIKTTHKREAKAGSREQRQGRRTKKAAKKTEPKTTAKKLVKRACKSRHVPSFMKKFC